MDGDETYTRGFEGGPISVLRHFSPLASLVAVASPSNSVS
jgi:hypothetical protein